VGKLGAAQAGLPFWALQSGFLGSWDKIVFVAP